MFLPGRMCESRNVRWSLGESRWQKGQTRWLKMLPLRHAFCRFIGLADPSPICCKSRRTCIYSCAVPPIQFILRQTSDGNNEIFASLLPSPLKVRFANARKSGHSHFPVNFSATRSEDSSDKRVGCSPWRFRAGVSRAENRQAGCSTACLDRSLRLSRVRKSTAGGGKPAPAANCHARPCRRHSQSRVETRRARGFPGQSGRRR